jgi:hypothetical protein
VRIAFFVLATMLLVSGLTVLGFWVAALLDAVIHHHAIHGKDPFFIVLLPVVGVLVLKWARDSWRRWHARPAA